MVKKFFYTIIFIIISLTGCSQTENVPTYRSLSSRESFSDKNASIAINEFIIDDTFQLVDKESSSLIPLSAADIEQIFRQYSFVGYNDDAIYIKTWDENYAYSFTRINYNSKTIENDIYANNKHTTFATEINDDYLFIGEAEPTENGFLTTIKRIHLNSTSFEVDVLLEITSRRLPYVSYAENYMVVTYSELDKYILGYMAYEDKEFIEIYTSTAKQNEDATYKGDMPMYGKGNDQGIYFQVIRLNNEFLDTEGRQFLYYYSFDEKKYQPILELFDKITYVDGNDDVVVTNDYSYHSPRFDTGRLLLLKENEAITIPNGTASNPIRDSNIWGDLLLVHTNNNMFFYDLNTFDHVSLGLPRENRSGIRIHENTFGYIEQGNNNVVFKRISYQDGRQ